MHPAALQAGVVLGKRVVVDTAHTVPAGTVVSLIQQSPDGSAGSDDETDWPGAGAQLGPAVAARDGDFVIILAIALSFAFL